MDGPVSRARIAALAAASLMGACTAPPPPAPPLVLAALEQALFDDGRPFAGQAVTVRGVFRIDAHGPDLVSPHGATGCLNLEFRDLETLRSASDMDGEDVTVVGTVVILSTGNAWLWPMPVRRAPCG